MYDAEFEQARRLLVSKRSCVKPNTLWRKYLMGKTQTLKNLLGNDKELTLVSLDEIKKQVVLLSKQA